MSTAGNLEILRTIIRVRLQKATTELLMIQFEWKTHARVDWGVIRKKKVEQTIRALRLDDDEFRLVTANGRAGWGWLAMLDGY